MPLVVIGITESHTCVTYMYMHIKCTYFTLNNSNNEGADLTVWLCNRPVCDLLHFPLVLMNGLNKTEFAVFLYCRCSLYLKDPFFQII